MVIEPSIFGIQQTLHQVGRELAKAHFDALSGRARQQAPDHLGLERGAFLREPVGIADAGDLLAP